MIEPNDVVGPVSFENLFFEGIESTGISLTTQKLILKSLPEWTTNFAKVWYI